MTVTVLSFRIISCPFIFLQFLSFNFDVKFDPDWIKRDKKLSSAQCVSWHLNWMHFVVHLDFEKLFPLVLLLWCSISDSEAEITTLPLGWEEAFGGSRADALSAWLKSEQESRGWAWQMLYYKKLGRWDVLCQLLEQY